MATKEQYVNAAKANPNDRTAEQQRLVDKGKNLQEVKNADFEARGRKN